MAVPLALSMLGATDNAHFVSLEELGWQAGQGLRTGANQFFYVDAVGDPHPARGLRGKRERPKSSIGKRPS